MGFTNVYGVPGWVTDQVKPRPLGPAVVIDGKAVAARVRTAVSEDVQALSRSRGIAPGLATILVGDDPASAVYVGAKIKACGEVGIESFHHPLPADAPQSDVEALIARLNADPAVSGILLQLPVPAHMDGVHLTNLISPDKDVDGLTAESTGRLALGREGLRPCTPSGVMTLLEEVGIDLSGKHAVVLGRSNLFGKPMAQMLLAADATVTICHRRSRDVPSLCRQADVLIAAVGRPHMVRGDWIKPGAVVIDVGINRTEDGLVGDVAFAEIVPVAGAVTPVPGGVGPLTIACLLRNTLQAAAAEEASSGMSRNAGSP